MKQNFKVSVCMITYGHENYISKAIEGVLMQECNFEVELILSNDCSPDKTDDIIQEFIANHSKSGWIKYFKQDNNLGMMSNFIFALHECQGKYIALCEGDDYWTDPLKLQKQIDFLEANHDHVLSFHEISILQSNGELVEDFITKIPEDYETQETLARKGNYIHTPSVVFRNVIKKFPPEFAMSPIGDYFLYMILTEHGKLHCMHEKMGVYRMGIGIWSSKSDYDRNFNTAYTFGLITNVFNNNEKISSILTDRIIFFLSRFENHVTPTDLVKLNVNENVSEKILNYYIENIKLLKVRKHYDDSSKNLIKILLKRIVKKINKI